MNSKQFKEAIDLDIKLRNHLVSSGRWRSCLNCEYWVGHAGLVAPHCDMFKAMPPPHIIVTGCNEHIDNIPF